MDDEKEKRQGSSGSGKSPTKFMERPGTKKEKKQETGSDFIHDDLDALESQEKDEDVIQGWDKPKPKGDQKPDQRKYQEPEKRDEKRDSSSGDTGDCACP
jgi:hypothetical protein